MELLALALLRFICVGTKEILIKFNLLPDSYLNQDVEQYDYLIEKRELPSSKNTLEEQVSTTVPFVALTHEDMGQRSVRSRRNRTG